MISYCGSMLTLRAGSRQQKLVITEAVVIGTVVACDENEGEDEEGEHLCLFDSSMSVVIFYAFLDYSLLSGENGIFKGRIMQLASLDVSLTTLLTSLKKREKRGRHRQNVYADMIISHVNEAVNQLIRQVPMLKQIKEPEELE